MIEFKNVSKSYDDTGTKALDSVNLKIDRGEFVFIVGDSGAGKSTLLKIIMREEVASEGMVIIKNHLLNTMNTREIPYFRRNIGIVFQDFRLIPSMTVYDNVAFAMRVIGEKSKYIKQRVPAVLKQVGLSDKAKSYPTQLSGGEQQRTALARAIVNKADIIIADEPTGNVDAKRSHEIVELLSEINKTGTTVIMVTHSEELVKTYGRRVITIQDGKIKSDDINNSGTVLSTDPIGIGDPDKDTGMARPADEFIRNYSSVDDEAPAVPITILPPVEQPPVSVENDAEEEVEMTRNMFSISQPSEEPELGQTFEQKFELVEEPTLEAADEPKPEAVEEPAFEPELESVDETAEEPVNELEAEAVAETADETEDEPGGEDDGEE